MESRLELIEQEQLAAQVVAVMDACFKRPDANEKRHVLMLADQQIAAQESVTLCASACEVIP